MNVTDYEKGSEFIILTVDDFKYESRFNKICLFLRQDSRPGMLVVPVDTSRLNKAEDQTKAMERCSTYAASLYKAREGADHE